MNNLVLLIGKVASKPKIEKLENGKNIAIITLGIPRKYKNIDGVYDIDYVDCVLGDVIAKNFEKICKVGDTVGIKGTIQNNDYNKENSMKIIVNKISFLKSKYEEDSLDDEEKEIEIY